MSEGHAVLKLKNVQLECVNNLDKDDDGVVLFGHTEHLYDDGIAPFYFHKSLPRVISAREKVIFDLSPPFGITIKNYDPSVTVYAPEIVIRNTSSDPGIDLIIEPLTANQPSPSLDFIATNEGDNCSYNEYCDNFFNFQGNPFVSMADFIAGFNPNVIAKRYNNIPYILHPNNNAFNRAIVIPQGIALGSDNPLASQFRPFTVGMPNEFNAHKVQFHIESVTAQSLGMIVTGNNTNLLGLTSDDFSWDPLETMNAPSIPQIFVIEASLHNCKSDTQPKSFQVFTTPQGFTNGGSINEREGQDYPNIIVKQAEEKQNIGDQNEEDKSNNKLISKGLINHNPGKQLSNFVQLPKNQQLIISPNPIDKFFNLDFKIRTDCVISISISDIYGKTIENLLDYTAVRAGEYHYSFDSSSLYPGVYFITLQAEGEKTTKKVIKM